MAGLCQGYGVRGGLVAVMRPTLNESERAVVRDEILSLHESKWTVHALTVMPDHVHVLATPLGRETGQWHSLSEILRSIKMGSAFSGTWHPARSLRGQEAQEASALAGRRGGLLRHVPLAKVGFSARAAGMR